MNCCYISFSALFLFFIVFVLWEKIYDMFNSKKLILTKEEIIPEALCDEVMRVLYDCANKYTYANTSAVVSLLNTKYTLQQVRGAVSILRYEKFVNFIQVSGTQVQSDLNPGGDDVVLELTYSGFGFINRDTLSEREKRRKFDKGVKIFAYRTRWIPLIISLSALIISIYGIVNSSIEKQPILIQQVQTGRIEGKRSVPVNTLDNHSKDTLANPKK